MSIEVISPAKIHAAPEGTYVVVDVRTPAEVRSEYIEGAVHQPLNVLEGGDYAVVQEANPQAQVVLTCASGKRAERAAKFLESKVERPLLVLEGGLEGWKAAGLPVERGQNGGLSLERQVRVAAGALVAVGAALALWVHPYWAALPLFVGLGLMNAGITGWCGMGLLIAKMPWNR